MSDAGGGSDPLTRGQRMVRTLVGVAAPEAVLGGSAAMAEQGLLGPPGGSRRWPANLDYYVPSTVDDNGWTFAPWAFLAPDWPGPQPSNLRSLLRITGELRGARRQFNVEQSRRPLGQRSEGVRLVVLAGLETVHAVFRPIYRPVEERERNTRMLAQDQLAREKIRAALDPERSTATHVVDMAAMLAVRGETWFDRTVRALYTRYGWRFDQDQLARGIVRRLQVGFLDGADATREELAGVLRGDRRRVDADVRGLLYYAGERMAPSVAAGWLRGETGQRLESGIHRALGGDPRRLDSSVDVHLQRAVEGGDRGPGI
jgi:hypothetical protein